MNNVRNSLFRLVYKSRRCICTTSFIRFNSTISRNINGLERQYKSLTGMNFSEYFNWFSEEIAIMTTKKLKQKITTDILPNIKSLNNHLEIGVGRANMITKLSSYFTNTTIIEPNHLFIDNAVQKKQCQTDYHIIQSMVQNVDFNDEYFNNNKFDLITMQQVLWHVPLNKWDGILNNLCRKCLNNASANNSTLIVTLFTETGPQYDIHKYFVPEIRMVDYVLKYFESKLSKNEYNIELYKNRDEVILPESVVIDSFVEMMKVDFIIYDENVFQQRKNEIIDITKQCLKRDGLYLDAVDEKTGQQLVKLGWEDGHVIVTKQI